MQEEVQFTQLPILAQPAGWGKSQVKGSACHERQANGHKGKQGVGFKKLPHRNKSDNGQQQGKDT